MRVIVVDDFLAVRLRIVRILRGLGFDVLQAQDGRVALEVIAEAGPLGLAFVDWNMPEMNGLELVRAVRADRRLDAMQIMMITTETEMAHVARALDAGANEYLMKPFTAAALTDKLTLLKLYKGTGLDACTHRR